jgi:prophage antirepressor-like protein
MDLIVREFEKHAVRMINENGEVYFVAADVAKVLGYKRPNDAVNSHCKGAVKRRIPTDGGNQELNVIPESDVYRLIFRSKLPAAAKFEDWVTKDVLPSIRKNGAYISSDATAAGIVAALEKSMEAKYALMLDNARLKSRLEILSMFQPTGKPGDISKTTGAEKWRFRRGFFCSGDKGRPASLLLQHPLQPDMFETYELTT